MYLLAKKFKEHFLKNVANLPNKSTTYFHAIHSYRQVVNLLKSSVSKFLPGTLRYATASYYGNFSRERLGRQRRFLRKTKTD